MSTFVVSITYAHTVTHVATKMLLLFKEIIRETGLDPSCFTDSWDSYERAISTWLNSRHLESVTLEVYDNRTDKLVTRWDMDVLYSTIGEGVLWVDTAAVRYAIVKAGTVPSQCNYDIIANTKRGAPHVPGWGSCSYRSTNGLKRFSLGSTVGGEGLSAQTSYWSS